LKITGESNSSPRRSEGCLPAIVHMQNFSDIVLTKSAERPRREVLARKCKFSETLQPAVDVSPDSNRRNGLWRKS
jgi:hypothetical protein